MNFPRLISVSVGLLLFGFLFWGLPPEMLLAAKHSLGQPGWPRANLVAVGAPASLQVFVVCSDDRLGLDVLHSAAQRRH